jgi:hypothetical protein
VFAQQTVDAIDRRGRNEFLRRRCALFFFTRFLPPVRPFTRRDLTQPLSIRIVTSMKRWIGATARLRYENVISNSVTILSDVSPEHCQY